MRLPSLFPLASLALALAGPLAAGAAEPAGELIDRVWSADPVSFALCVERGHQFIAYYDAERRLTVLGRAAGEKRWVRIQPPGVPVPGEHRLSNVTGWDSHDYLRLALDRAGGVHLAGNMHSNPLVYYRSEAPFDVASLERIDRMTGGREERCTYPVFFKDAAGNLLFRYRDGGSGNGVDLYNVYDASTRTWRRVVSTPILDGEGRRNAYALDPVLGPDGRFHLVWMWRDTPDCSTNNHLSYARSRDLVHWETSAGQPITLPITLAKGEEIDDARPHEGLINMAFALGFDAGQRPVVVYHRYDASHRSQIFAARPSTRGPGWDRRQISDWNFTWAFSGFGSIAAEVTVGAPQPDPAGGALQVDFSSRAAGDGRWHLDPGTLAAVATLPPPPPVLPEPLLRPAPNHPGMEVQTVSALDQGWRWVLRWETLPRNRDLPRTVIPPPTELRLYKVPDDKATMAARVGS